MSRFDQTIDSDDEEQEPLLESEKHAAYSPAILNRNMSREHQSTSPEAQAGLSFDSNSLDYEEGTEHDVIVVFVVTFDTRHHSGNIIEWQTPADVDLNGVEFKAIYSGAHTIDEDFVYFVHGSFFGLACYKKIAVQSAAERGVRMKAVGLLTTAQHTLHKHFSFLKQQVGLYVSESQSCDYGPLQRHFARCRGTALPATVSQGDHAAADSLAHPDGCFSHFLDQFGLHVFSLWKLALLHRRILFYFPPPVGRSCFHVHCTRVMSLYDTRITDNRNFKTCFFVNIADIDSLATEMSFVACTTERVFEEKPQLWDVFVTASGMRTENNALRDVIKTTSSDKRKLKRLQQARQSATGSVSDEEIVSNYFRAENNLLLDTLLLATEQDARLVTRAALEHMHLEPGADRAFLVELLETYGIDLTLEESSCCNL